MFSQYWWYFEGPTIAASGAAPAPSGALGGPWLRLGPEVRLPQWVTARAALSGTTFNLCQYVAERRVPLAAAAHRVFASQWLGEAEVGVNRLEWQLLRSFPTQRDLTVTVTTNLLAGPQTLTVRPARSRYDYDTAPEPVWWRDDGGRIQLRGLFLRTTQIQDGRGVYSINGEARGIVPDAGFYYRRVVSQEWEWLSPESPRASGNTVTLPLSGTYLIAYGSQDALLGLQSGTATVSWPGGQSIPLPLSAQKPGNLFDAYGDLLGLPRLKGEDNLAFKQRLLAGLVGPPDSTLAGVTRGIAGELGQLFQATWDGVHDLVLDGTGALGITDITVPNLARLREIDEELTPASFPGSGSLQYWASYANWRPGGIVLAAGVPLLNTSVSGNLVTLASPASGRVTARYSIQQWSAVPVASGYLGTLKAGTGVASGSYPVLCSQQVQLSVPDLLSTQQARLLDPVGMPTRLFRELAAVLAADNPTTFGRARWGPSAYWLQANDDRPSGPRLPIPFDVVS